MGKLYRNRGNPPLFLELRGDEEGLPLLLGTSVV